MDPLPLARPRAFPLTRPLELTCFGLCVAQAVYLAAAYVQGSWLLDASGQPLATDFVNVWAAGRTALDGHPAAVYDVALHKAAEDAALGRGFDGGFPWIYPPTFLFAAVPLALLPLVTAHVVWVFSTFSAYVAAVRAIIGQRVGFLFALAYPGLLSNFIVGQNGFLTATLLGAFLVTMQRRPWLAGAFLGLLSFKPHLGLLLPLALIAGAQWRVLAAAAVAVAMLMAASAVAFGLDAWIAFFHALPVASQSALAEGHGDWAKMQSAFTLVRWLGGDERLAWTLQACVIVVVAILLCLTWRSRMRFELKAAALATGALLATPYLFLYDLVVLAVPMAFLLRLGGEEGFLAGELPALGVACLLILVFPLVKAPVGLAAIVVVALLIARRALAMHDVSVPQPHRGAQA